MLALMPHLLAGAVEAVQSVSEVGQAARTSCDARDLL
jgi:hypothetical protein